MHHWILIELVFLDIITDSSPVNRKPVEAGIPPLRVVDEQNGDRCQRVLSLASKSFLL